MSTQDETTTVDPSDAEPTTSPKKLSAIGGFVGTAIGSRVSRGGAVLGALVGGTVGYLAGAARRGRGVDAAATEPEPVAINVADTDEETDDSGGATADDDDDETA